VRSQTDAVGRLRFRIETLAAGVGNFSTQSVVETYVPVERVWSNYGGPLLLARDPATREPSIYMSTGVELQFVRRGYEILDLDPNDQSALVTPHKGTGLFLMSLADGSLRRLGPPSFQPLSAVYGPGNDAAITTPGALWLLHHKDGRLQRLADTSGAEPVGPIVWHPEGRWLFYLGDAALWAVKVAGGQPVEAIRWTTDPTPLAIGFQQ